MGEQDLVRVALPLTARAEAAAALAARLRLDLDGIDAEPVVVEALDRVVSAVAPAGVLDGVDADFGHDVVATVTSFLKLALDLVEHPGRPAGWVHTDPVILRSQGRTSAGIPGLIARSLPHLPGLEAALAHSGARVLDIGSGVAAFAVACCETFPAANVVGLEPWPPALDLGRTAVTAAGLDDHITLRAEGMEDLTDESSFDLVWMPAAFLPPPVLAASTPRVAEALRPGGWLVLGRHAAPADPLAAALADLRTVRGGGTLLTEDAAVALLEDSGLVNVRVVPRDWSFPVHLVAGQHA